jgi:Uma2 family endonuclease
MATRPEAKLTYADYVTLPDERRWELIEGEAFVIPSPDQHHQDVVLRLACRIADRLDLVGGGTVIIAPFDVILSPDESTVVQPDVLFVSDDDAGVLTGKNVRGAPTWAIEVVSDPVRDKRDKRDLYTQYGVEEYWAVDPDLRQVDIYRRGRPTTIVRAPDRPSSAALPGLDLDLDALFAR